MNTPSLKLDDTHFISAGQQLSLLQKFVQNL